MKNKNRENKLTLLHTGRVAKGKGQSDAIKACSILVENNIDFVFYIVGGFEESYKDEFLELYDNLEYKDKIVLVGFSNKVEKYLEKSDIFIFPSYGEGFGNSFIEAMSAGLHCIAYSNTSFLEFKELGLDFEMVEDRNIEKLKEVLLQIANNNVKINTAKNKTIINEYFSEEREIKEFLNILN